MKAAYARVLLTGAGGGIGQAIAGALVKAGAAVMLAGRSPARMASLARSLRRPDAGPDDVAVQWHEVDLEQGASILRLAQAATAWDCNAVVHCAGVAAFGAFESQAPAHMARVLQVNLTAPMLLTHALLPHLRSLPAAQVICVGSALGAIALPGYSIYSASKFGLRGFAQAVRRELGDTQVRIQYLGPRTTRTSFNSADVTAYNRATGTATDEPALVARALLALLEDGAGERFLGFPEKLGVRLNGFAPVLMDSAFKRHRHNVPAQRAATPPALPEEMNNAH